MKFNLKQYLAEQSEYVGFSSDTDVAPTPLAPQPYQGIADPKHSMGALATVHQNQADFKVKKSMDQQQLDQLQTSVFAYLAGEFLDPRQALYNVKVKLNHMGLDFDFNKNIELKEGSNTFVLSRFGQKFGTTPTNNLMQGFDRGTDYTDSSLTFDLMKSQSGKYYFRNVKLEQGSTQSVQAESVYAAIANDEYIFENIFKPIVLNLLEKAQNDSLDQDTFEKQVNFIVERSTKHLGIELNESEKENVSKGLAKLIPSTAMDEPGTNPGQRRGEGSMDRINALAMASGIDVSKQRREKRRLMLKRLKGNIK